MKRFPNILLNTNHKVDVHNPEVKIKIEIQKEDTYITSNKIEGADRKSVV